MNIPSKPEAIVFDLDDTIYSYSEPNEYANGKLLKFLVQETSMQTSEISKAYEQGRETVKRRLGETGSSHARLLYLNEMLRVLQVNPKPSFLLRAEQVYWSSYYQKMEIREGFQEVIEEARLQKIQLFLVSDLTLQTQLKKLIALNLDSTFDYIFTSEELGGDKVTGLPYSEILPLLEKMNCIWFVGDSETDFIVNHPNNYFFKFGNNARLEQKNIFQNANFLKMKKILDSYA